MAENNIFRAPLPAGSHSFRSYNTFPTFRYQLQEGSELDSGLRFSSLQGAPGMQASRKRKRKKKKVICNGEHTWGEEALLTCSRDRKGKDSPFPEERRGRASPAWCSTPRNPCSLRSPAVVVLQAARKTPIYILNLGSLHCPVSTASEW